MSSAMHLLVVDPAPNKSEDTWQEFLAARIDPTWRLNEWDQASWTFVGDPEEPFTRVHNCHMAGCSNRCVTSSYCPACQVLVKKVDPSEWAQRVADKERRSTKNRRVGRQTGNVVIADVPEPVRSELLYAMQEDSRQGQRLDPALFQQIAKLCPEIESISSPGFLDLGGEYAPRRAVVARLFQHVSRLHAEHSGVDLMEADVWDLNLVGLPSGEDRNVSRHYRLGALDFGVITQEWLRRTTKHYIRDHRPKVAEARRIVKVIAMLSDALRLRPDSDDPTMARREDITRFVGLIRAAKPSQGYARRGGSKEAGSTYSLTAQQQMLSTAKHFLEYNRSTGDLNDVPKGFAVVSSMHKIRRADKQERVPVHCPVRATNQLLAGLDTFAYPEQRKKYHALRLNADERTHMMRTALLVLMETGRRPGEVVSLKLDCIDSRANSSGSIDYVLLYDNHKAGREARRLPISAEVANVIMSWQERRRGIEAPGSEDYLFVPLMAGYMGIEGSLTTNALRSTLSHLVKHVGALDSDIPDAESPTGYKPFEGSITPYSFRHAFAQRHADQNVAVDTLRALMDHKNISTTQGYYSVSDDRKREAIKLVAAHVLDRHGEVAPEPSVEGYELGTVAAPFGGCSDPVNVKAGGKHCPIRFRCIGCDYYRPDPSYLPAMKQMLADLRSDYALVQARGSSADWVTREMKEEISQYKRLAERMESRIDSLDTQAKAEVLEAADELRRDREGRLQIPLSVVKREPR